MLLPSNDRVLSSRFVDSLHRRIAARMAKSLRDGAENLRDVVNEFRVRHRISRNDGILAHACDPLVRDLVLVRFEIIARGPPDKKAA